MECSSGCIDFELRQNTLGGSGWMIYSQRECKLLIGIHISPIILAE